MSLSQECFGYDPNLRLEEYLQILGGTAAQFNGFVVAIDSYRFEDVAANSRFRYAQLEATQIVPDWQEGGFWLRGHDLIGANSARLIVPFTAIYIFPSSIRRCERPTFAETSEYREFSEGVPDELRQYMAKVGAVGYVADGAGLNYLLFSEALCLPFTDMDAGLP